MALSACQRRMAASSGANAARNRSAATRRALILDMQKAEANPIAPEMIPPKMLPKKLATTVHHALRAAISRVLGGALHGAHRGLGTRLRQGEPRRGLAARLASRQLRVPTYDYRGLRWSAAHSPPIATEIPNQAFVAARAQIHQAMPTALVRARPVASMRWGQGAAAIISQ